jgi:hypothetical protein
MAGENRTTDIYPDRTHWVNSIITTNADSVGDRTDRMSDVLPFCTGEIDRPEVIIAANTHNWASC